MDGSSTKFTQKIIISYLLLVILAGIASFYVYSEIHDYLSTETEEENDNKLLKTNSFLSQLYEAERLSKLTLQSKKRKNFIAYASKIDSIFKDITALRTLSENEQQQYLLDSLQLLLEKKVRNTEVLRKLKTQDQTSVAISTALKEFDQMEANLGVITAEGLAPNLNELSPKAQETIRKVAQYLNDNIPTDDADEELAKSADSILKVSRGLLKEVQDENIINLKALTEQEVAINKTDIELSQQLRDILSSFEKEILVNSINDNIKKETALKRSIRLASSAALLGFLVVVLFIFILNRDFWKANLYRQNLEKEKKFSDLLLKSRERLIRTVSHDVRTPLNSISGYTELLEDSEVSRKQKKYLSSIRSATSYMNNLVNDLLDFSQLEAEKMTPEKIAFNLSDLLIETAQNIATAQTNKNISLSIHMDNALEKPIINDPIRIRQIVSNLLGNAYKFTKKGEIRLIATIVNKSENNKEVSISISDTGVGISGEQQHLIFNEFTQVLHNKEEKYTGYGLGLAISKKLTKLLKGSLTVESELGKGSVFTLKFPIVFDSKEKKEKALEQPVPLKKPLRILIIDDDTSFLHMLGEMLGREGVTPLLFNDFNMVPKIASDLSYDLVLTDIEMPNASGFDVVRHLLSENYGHYKNQPIIAMTGRKNLEKDFFLSKGFTAVLKKPFSKSAILQQIGILHHSNKIALNYVEENSNKKGLYQIDLLQSFLGDDSSAIRELLVTFQNDIIKNRHYLSTAIDSRNSADTAKVAHRMLPMFRQLKIQQAIPMLEKFEEIAVDYNDWKNLKTDFDKLDMVLNELATDIHNDITTPLNHNG